MGSAWVLGCCPQAPPSEATLLVGDIGGTNARLSLWRADLASTAATELYSKVLPVRRACSTGAMYNRNASGSQDGLMGGERGLELSPPPPSNECNLPRPSTPPDPAFPLPSLPPARSHPLSFPQTYPTMDYSTFEAVVGEFLSEPAPTQSPPQVGLSVGGAANPAHVRCTCTDISLLGPIRLRRRAPRP